MSNTQISSPSPDFRKKFMRKAASAASPFTTEFFSPVALIPLVVRPDKEGIDLASWAGEHKEFIDTKLQAHRAVLFRGFQVKTPAHFEWFVKATSAGPLLEYKDRSTPRREVTQKVYVSTIYPADEQIHLHNEGTYWKTWPLKIYFCCMKAAASGGETPIADVRNVCKRIDSAVREEFIKRQVMYVRNYNPGVGLTWQDAFQTSDPKMVEDYGQKNSIQIEWKPDGRLVTRQIRPAVRKHPLGGEMTWFNHAAFFHVSSLAPTVREALLSSFQEEGLPYNTYYGDGARIEPDVVAHIREAYEAEKLKFLWQEGDVLLLDNMSVAHAREPYKGERNVIVAMTEAQSESPVNPN